MVQPEITGIQHGIPRMIYGSDGSNWYAIKVRDSGIVEVCSKSGDKIFGFESIVEEAKENTNLAAGTNGLSGTPVGAGKIWKITSAMIKYDGTAPTKIALEAAGLATEFVLLDQKPPVVNQHYFWNGEIYLQVGDYMFAWVEGATAGDDFFMKYVGVQMNAP